VRKPKPIFKFEIKESLAGEELILTDRYLGRLKFYTALFNVNPKVEPTPSVLLTLIVCL
jgi:hypothetical protein